MQASKKGIMEVADIIVVHKADGNMLPLARHSKADYSGSIEYIRNKKHMIATNFKRKVVMASSKTGDGIEGLMRLIDDYYDLVTCTTISNSITGSTTGSGSRASMKHSSLLQYKRDEQSTYWMWQQFTRSLSSRLSIHYEMYKRNNSNFNNSCDGSGSSSGDTSDNILNDVSKQAVGCETEILNNEISARTASNKLLTFMLKQ